LCERVCDAQRAVTPDRNESIDTEPRQLVDDLIGTIDLDE